ncbi:MAG: hypothetical protein M1839_004954 [Geoglossum umbratile]|nr:MAG: hypothetical protein M1839_004954 [Geoglossum umbratile]
MADVPIRETFHDTFGTCVDESNCEGFVTSGLCRTPVDAIKCCTGTFAPYNGEAGSPGDLSQSGINFIHSFEGFVEHFYCDKVHPVQTPPLGPRGPCRHELNEGTLTIGWGHSCESHNCSGLDDTITQEKGDQLFASGVADTVRNMNARLDPNLFLSQNQFDALCSFGYNGGP